MWQSVNDLQCDFVPQIAKSIGKSDNFVQTRINVRRDQMNGWKFGQILVRDCQRGQERVVMVVWTAAVDFLHNCARTSLLVIGIRVAVDTPHQKREHDQWIKQGNQSKFKEIMSHILQSNFIPDGHKFKPKV